MQEAQGIPTDVNNVLNINKEALVITANPDSPEGESTIAVYSKLLDKGVITPMLSNILKNLLIPDETTTKQKTAISP
tara:strand:- start:269 stop:499 length:231 start_codon:yes stop_codon:yes gene_type:complete